MDIAGQIITFLTAGLLVYFLQENLKTGKDAESSAKNNGKKLNDLYVEIESVKNDLKSVVSRIDATMDNINLWQKNLDRTFEINTDRHGEILVKSEDIMREQRKVVATVDLERERLNSFAEAGIKLSERVKRNAGDIKKVDDALMDIKKRWKDLVDEDSEE